MAGADHPESKHDHIFSLDDARSRRDTDETERLERQVMERWTGPRSRDKKCRDNMCDPNQGRCEVLQDLEQLVPSEHTDPDPWVLLQEAVTAWQTQVNISTFHNDDLDLWKSCILEWSRIYAALKQHNNSTNLSASDSFCSTAQAVVDLWHEYTTTRNSELRLLAQRDLGAAIGELSAALGKEPNHG